MAELLEIYVACLVRVSRVLRFSGVRRAFDTTIERNDLIPTQFRRRLADVKVEAIDRTFDVSWV